MSRVNKYRAWNTEKKIMCYDNEDLSACYWDGAYGSEVGMINEYLNLPEHLKTYEYMQCIGVKDKNGKEIYEGDIVRLPKCENDIAVFILRGCNYFLKGKRSNYEIGSYYSECFEVIGNVYENADLLKEVNGNE